MALGSRLTAVEFPKIFFSPDHLEESNDDML